MDQAEHDARSLALHRQVCELLRAEPALLERARATIERWSSRDGRRLDDARLAWDALLTAGDLDRIVAAATDPGEAGAELRQSSPLACLMAPRERWQGLRAWKAARGA